ncbi:hypothetical protein HK100_000038 [Physocladia obscura]|uniref:Uncharacterized protein n=1 Tax=Physocladia obscura TaxID=109957 RepID=A0AAD5TA83_9FUNG|nr:hypothetical protein HK100_000038 [Physocladia obscura]
MTKPFYIPFIDLRIETLDVDKISVLNADSLPNPSSPNKPPNIIDLTPVHDEIQFGQVDEYPKLVHFGGHSKYDTWAMTSTTVTANAKQLRLKEADVEKLKKFKTNKRLDPVLQMETIADFYDQAEKIIAQALRLPSESIPPQMPIPALVPVPPHISPNTPLPSCPLSPPPAQKIVTTTPPSPKSQEATVTLLQPFPQTAKSSTNLSNRRKSEYLHTHQSPPRTLSRASSFCYPPSPNSRNQSIVATASTSATIPVAVMNIVEPPPPPPHRAIIAFNSNVRTESTNSNSKTESTIVATMAIKVEKNESAAATKTRHIIVVRQPPAVPTITISSESAIVVAKGTIGRAASWREGRMHVTDVGAWIQLTTRGSSTGGKEDTAEDDDVTGTPMRRVNSGMMDGSNTFGGNSVSGGLKGRRVSSAVTLHNGVSFGEATQRSIAHLSSKNDVEIENGSGSDSGIGKSLGKEQLTTRHINATVTSEISTAIPVVVVTPKRPSSSSTTIPQSQLRNSWAVKNNTAAPQQQPSSLTKKPISPSPLQKKIITLQEFGRIETTSVSSFKHEKSNADCIRQHVSVNFEPEIPAFINQSTWMNAHVQRPLTNVAFCDAIQIWETVSDFKNSSQP